MIAKDDNNRFRCQIAAAECLAENGEDMLRRGGSAMLSAHFLSSAIAQLSGAPGKKERRSELRHRLVDVQSSISEEMTEYSHGTDIKEFVEKTQGIFEKLSLRDQLFYIAEFPKSPPTQELVNEAKASIQKHPLSFLFETSHMDGEGKVISRTPSGAFSSPDELTIKRQISDSESRRRGLIVAANLEPARRVVISQHLVSEDVIDPLMRMSPFVPVDLVSTFSRGFARLFQGDFVSAAYILIPLLENSIRYVLKNSGFDVTNFDDATQTQQDRTISSIFEQMRGELDDVFTPAIVSDIERLFLTKPGPHLRHRLAHGLFHDNDPYSSDSIYACWMIFRLCLLPLFPHRTEIVLLDMS